MDRVVIGLTRKHCPACGDTLIRRPFSLADGACRYCPTCQEMLLQIRFSSLKDCPQCGARMRRIKEPGDNASVHYWCLDCDKTLMTMRLEAFDRWMARQFNRLLRSR